MTEEQPLDPAAAGLVARVRRLMLISGATTLIAIAAVIGAIGYRVYRSGESAAGASADVVATLPKGARVVSIAAAEDRIVVTIDLAGTLEARTFDAKTLNPTGRLRFVTEP